MDEVVIKKKDVDRLAKELLKEIFDFLHDEYILNSFTEMKIEQKKFLNNLVSNHISTLKRQSKITEEQRKELVKPLFNKFIDYKLRSSRDEEYFSKLVKDAMKDDGIDTEGIYLTLNDLNFYDDIECNLYFKKESFLDIFRVFDIGYTYLKD